MTMIVREFFAMRKMAAGQFKVHCLKVMDEVQAKREAVLITKRGKPVAKLVPVDNDGKKDEIFGFLKGKGKIVGDIISPAISPEEWGDLY
jgi:prevent-host-death family protein